MSAAVCVDMSVCVYFGISVYFDVGVDLSTISKGPLLNEKRSDLPSLRNRP